MDRTQLPAWQSLQQHIRKLREAGLGALFTANPQRFAQFSWEVDGILVDCSKHFIDAAAIDGFERLADAVALPDAIDDLVSGAYVNATERRAALHSALRCPAERPLIINGVDINEPVQEQLGRMAACIEELQKGSWQGFAGDRFRDVVCLGIGGSQLGPQLGCQALRSYATNEFAMHFAGNIDPGALRPVLDQLNPRRTLFVLASKTFTTQETMHNAGAAKAWLAAASGSEESIMRHFLAVTASTERALAFGIPPAQVLSFWDWVGGRYSVWSCVGFPLALSLGMNSFRDFLAGAHAVDQHFTESPVKNNVPILLGMLDVCYRNFLGTSSLCVVPYESALALLPAYLQQLAMESNGKSCNQQGYITSTPTSPVIWGAPGTEGQHAFFQMLHQGPDLIPVDFLLGRTSRFPLADHHDILVANCLAQSQALMLGKSTQQAYRELIESGFADEEAQRLAPHKSCPGNRPSTTFCYPTLSPRSLGALLALWEHRVFIQAQLWNINPFDQWGVELGKRLAGDVVQAMQQGQPATDLDGSTRGLLHWYLNRG
jgi:glucose-6-phosphate isomerase